MKSKTTLTKHVLACIIFLFITMHPLLSQDAKKSSTKTPAPKSSVKPATKTATKVSAKESKVPVKATITSDMDCTVKINGAAKEIKVKANTPVPALLKIGENTIEALGSDLKSTFKNTVLAQAGETKKVNVSFLGENKFLEYIKQGNVNMVETAIKKNPILATNEGDILASSPIVVAIENSQFDIIKLLISNGASFTAPFPIYPLHTSILFASSEKADKDKPASDRELVDFFLSKGCRITDKDSSGNTPLHCAALAKKLDLVMYLMALGADINAKNNLGDTPLKIAEDKGEISIISLIMAKDAQEKSRAAEHSEIEHKEGILVKPQ